MVFGVYCQQVRLVIKKSWWDCHSEKPARLVRTVVLRFEPLWDSSESPDARATPPHC